MAPRPPDPTSGIATRLVVDRGLGILRFPADDAVMAPAIEQDGVWEPLELAWLQGHVQPGANCLNVGANVGYFTCWMSRLAGDAGRVWAIEPNPQLTGLLTENISAAGPPNVTVVAHAAGATRSTTLLWLNEASLGDSRVFDPRLTNGGGDYRAHGFPLEPNAVTVEVKTIDAILDGSHLDVALIDTQGWDHEVLRGMRQTLERDHPWV